MQKITVEREVHSISGDMYWINGYVGVRAEHWQGEPIPDGQSCDGYFVPVEMMQRIRDFIEDSWCSDEYCSANCLDADSELCSRCDAKQALLDELKEVTE